MGTVRAGATGSLDRRSWLCALRFCSVLHNQEKLLKWGEPEGEGEGEGRRGRRAREAPPLPPDLEAPRKRGVGGGGSRARRCESFPPPARAGCSPARPWLIFPLSPPFPAIAILPAPLSLGLLSFVLPFPSCRPRCLSPPSCVSCLLPGSPSAVCLSVRLGP